MVPSDLRDVAMDLSSHSNQWLHVCTVELSSATGSNLHPASEGMKE